MLRLLLLCTFFFGFLSSVYAGDLAISSADISFRPAPAISGQATKIYITVHNNSNDDMNGVMRMYDETAKKDVGTDIPFALIAKASQTVFTTHIFEGYGNHSVAARIIPFSSKGDDLNNNKAFAKIFVDGDFDKDGIGDSVDTDFDGDGTLNNQDAFPKNPKEWLDTDGDGMGNNADEDDDNDTFKDIRDAFPLDPKEWNDTDKDGIGDNSDPDIDGDGISNDEEILTDPLNPDSDGDGTDDKQDQYPLDSKRNIDTDNDGISNFDDFDDDNDKIADNKDTFPLDPDEWEDSDEDGIGNNADPDDDNDEWTDEYEIHTSKTNPLHADSDKDGILDPKDLYPIDPTEWEDTDKDGIGNNSDNDDDNDKTVDNEDHFPFDPKEWKDTDKDGLGDNADLDDDNDGVPDTEDAFPFDPKEWKDTDKDGLGDNADPNDQNHGPVIEILPLPEKMIQGQKLELRSKVSDPDGIILGIEWSDDEGKSGKEEIFTTVFHKPGKHEIRIKVTDDMNESREKTLDIYVKANWTPYISLGSFLILFGIFWAIRKRVFQKKF